MSNWSCDILANMIKARVRDDKNYMGISIGQTGSGKSLTTARILGAVDDSFYDECRVVFTPSEYMDAIRNMDKYQAVMFDESGVGISHREWMHTQNKLIGMTTQLFRHLNLITVYTVPHIDFIDVMERKLLHGIIEMRDMDKEKGFSISKYWMVDTDAMTGSIRTKHVKYGNNALLDPIVTPLPPESFIKKYVKMKEEYAQNFYKNTLQELKEGSAGKIDKRTIDAYKRKEECLGKLIADYKKVHTWKDIEIITGISGRTLRDWYGANDDT